MLCNCGHSQVTLIFLIEDTSWDKGVVLQPFLKQCFSCLAVSRWQAMQCWRLYTRHRCLPAARLHILLASGIRAEKERRRTGEKRRCGCCATFANVTDLELLCSCCELWSIPNVKQSFFLWFENELVGRGQVQCSNSRDFSLFSPVTGDLCGQRNRNTTVARCRSHCHMQGMKWEFSKDQ